MHLGHVAMLVCPLRQGIRPHPQGTPPGHQTTPKRPDYIMMPSSFQKRGGGGGCVSYIGPMWCWGLGQCRCDGTPIQTHIHVLIVYARACTTCVAGRFSFVIARCCCGFRLSEEITSHFQFLHCTSNILIINNMTSPYS